MTWARLDDAFPGHPKIDPLSDGAFRLHVTAICWSCQWLTDGFIPDDRLRTLPGYRYKASHVAELVTARPPSDRALWDKVDGGYQIHDFLAYQQPASRVRADREAAADRMRRRRNPKPTGSPDVRPNTERTSGEVRSVFADPVPYPSRTPPPPQSSSGSTPPTDPEEEDPAVAAADAHAQRALAAQPAGQVHDTARWKAEARRRWLSEHRDRCRTLLATNPALDAVELLAQVEKPTSLPGYRIAPPVVLPDPTVEERASARAVITDIRTTHTTGRNHP